MIKELALTIGKGTSSQFDLSFPTDIANLNTFTLPDLISRIVPLVITIAVILTLFFMLFGGIRWIMSQGDKKQLESAQKTIQFALIGLVLILLSFFIINLIGFIFGVNLLKASF